MFALHLCTLFEHSNCALSAAVSTILSIRAVQSAVRHMVQAEQPRSRDLQTERMYRNVSTRPSAFIIEAVCAIEVRFIYYGRKLHEHEQCIHSFTHSFDSLSFSWVLTLVLALNYPAIVLWMIDALPPSH